MKFALPPNSKLTVTFDLNVGLVPAELFNVRRAIEAALETLGWSINHGGMYTNGSFAEIDAEKDDEHIAVYISAVRLTGTSDE